ncbi:hypothetical protein [Celeribacter ethanolicus]|uniref:hypothetical protein n=1 Tax=Celeribacter ethanolicus TaxID=1758178 RepID=UPI000836A817|nr:hypothetical protein [Celeribacter ethanolicus]
MTRIAMLSALLLSGCYGFVVDHRSYGTGRGPTATLSVTATHRLDHLSLAHCDDSAPPLVLIARKRDDPRRDPAWEITLDANTCYEVEARSWRLNFYKRLTLAPDASERIALD